jgi:hypothetical protein
VWVPGGGGRRRRPSLDDLTAELCECVLEEEEGRATSAARAAH